jgi:hypothetical protein
MRSCCARDRCVRKHSHFRLAPTTERIWLDGLLEYSPSLKTILANELPKYYAGALRLATAMARNSQGRGQFPAECPFTVEEILAPEFVPRVE